METVEKGAEIAIHPKGWGYEKWIVNKEDYCGKLLHMIKGKKCSWHYHTLKDETFYLQDGKILLKYSDDDDIKKANETVHNRGDKFHIYTGLRNQMFDLEDTDLFEFSTQHFEHDSNRVIPGD